MPTYTKNLLSESVSGESILIELSASPGRLIHTATNAPGLDEIWLYASNNTVFDAILTLNWGTSGERDLISRINIQAYTGPVLIMPGLVLNSSAKIYAFANTLSSINILGYVNRIS